MLAQKRETGRSTAALTSGCWARCNRIVRHSPDCKAATRACMAEYWEERAIHSSSAAFMPPDPERMRAIDTRLAEIARIVAESIPTVGFSELVVII
jgi:hypothetical protein